jgi:hypothetical protein
VADGGSPPEGFVADDTDCDDADERTYPGAATQETADACTKDTDEDGWADAAPPQGVLAGTDCDDTDPLTHPGAADLDDTAACMRDADDDGFGDTMPPRGGIAGTDCNDANTDVPSVDACLTWCADADEDQFGDPNTCVLDEAPPRGYVGNDADCDDSTADAFPGAAPLDDADACMLDIDGDDYGDATPANAAITQGTDCDDLEALVFDSCIDCPADMLFCDASDNVAQCNATGSWGSPTEACGFGCDDTNAVCWDALSVDAGACAQALDGASAPLSAIATGGDGNYSYAWSPAGSVSPDDAAMVQAAPSRPTTYGVSVTDGEGNNASDQVTVHLSDRHWNLELDGCASHTWADIYEGSAPAPIDIFVQGGEAHCNLAVNGVPQAFVCPQVIDQARVTFDLEVANQADNDAIGFVWGWQDASHFYLFSWKQADEATPWGTWTEGVTIKRIEADDPADITGEDLGADYDTAHGTVLATGGVFHGAGWENRELYRVTVVVAGDQTAISIHNLDDNGVLVATGSISDGVLGAGAMGSYNASQRSTCTDHWTSTCL